MSGEGEVWLDEVLGLCEICDSAQGKYRCPKCGVVYCSVGCYQGHNWKCVTVFSEGNLKKLEPSKASFESQVKMKRILEIAKGSHVPTVAVEPWDAWWTRKIISNAPSPNYGSPIRVSANLEGHLVDILYSYCYVMRVYNGDVSFDIDGCCEMLLSISTILGSKCRESKSVKQALKQCMEKTKRSDIFVEYQWQIEVVHDVELCLRTREHVYRCISESIAITMEGKAKFSYAKLQFFFAWAQTLTLDLVKKIRCEVHNYYTSLRVLLDDIYAVDAARRG
jgi:hypothetical protein